MKLPKVYVIGDSISIHYGPYLERYLRGRFAYARKTGEEEALRNLDKPMGANGGDSSRVLAFLGALLAAGPWEADMLLVNCGLHDIRTDPQTKQCQIGLGDYRRNLQAIVALCRQKGVTWAWMRTTPVDDAAHNKPGMTFFRYARDLETYNAAADEIMRAAGVPTLDLYSLTLNLGGNLFCDHVHFHEPVREKQAAFIAGWLDGWQVKNAGQHS